MSEIDVKIKSGIIVGDIMADIAMLNEAITFLTDKKHSLAIATKTTDYILYNLNKVYTEKLVELDKVTNLINSFKSKNVTNN
jgi:soluble P-type ATPase